MENKKDSEDETHSPKITAPNKTLTSTLVSVVGGKADFLTNEKAKKKENGRANPYTRRRLDWKIR